VLVVSNWTPLYQKVAAAQNPPGQLQAAGIKGETLQMNG
jgi:hypothetical protein